MCLGQSAFLEIGKTVILVLLIDKTTTSFQCSFGKKKSFSFISILPRAQHHLRMTKYLVNPTPTENDNCSANESKMDQEWVNESRNDKGSTNGGGHD